MTHETDKAAKPLRSIPPDIQALFGDPPLLSTEDPDLYWGMLDRLAESVAPRSTIEWLWIMDIGDLSWEIARLRRDRTQQIEGARENRHATIEYQRKHPDDHGLWLDPPSRELIKARRNAPRLDTEADSANLLILEYLETYETIDKLLMSAEVRRDRILRELDFRRERIAPLLRKTSDALIDVHADSLPLAAE